MNNIYLKLNKKLFLLLLPLIIILFFNEDFFELKNILLDFIIIFYFFDLLFISISLFKNKKIIIGFYYSFTYFLIILMRYLSNFCIDKIYEAYKYHYLSIATVKFFVPTFITIIILLSTYFIIKNKYINKETSNKEDLIKNIYLKNKWEGNENKKFNILTVFRILYLIFFIITYIIILNIDFDGFTYKNLILYCFYFILILLSIFNIILNIKFNKFKLFFILFYYLAYPLFLILFYFYSKHFIDIDAATSLPYYYFFIIYFIEYEILLISDRGFSKKIINLK